MVVYPDTSPIILKRSHRLKDRFSEGVETVILDRDRLGNKGFWEPGSVLLDLRVSVSSPCQSVVVTLILSLYYDHL